MKSIRIAIRIAFATWAFALCNAAMATKPSKPPTTPAPIVIVEKERSYTEALVAAGIAAWIMHRRAKRHRPEPIEPPKCPAPEPTTDEKSDRILETCLAK